MFEANELKIIMLYIELYTKYLNWRKEKGVDVIRDNIGK